MWQLHSLRQDAQDRPGLLAMTSGATPTSAASDSPAIWLFSLVHFPKVRSHIAEWNAPRSANWFLVSSSRRWCHFSYTFSRDYRYLCSTELNFSSTWKTNRSGVVKMLRRRFFSRRKNGFWLMNIERISGQRRWMNECPLRVSIISLSGVSENDCVVRNSDPS